VSLITEFFCVQVPLPVSEHISPAQVTAENQYDSLAAVVTPLWQTPYNEQLAIKFQWSHNVMQNVVKKLYKQMKNRNFKKISYRLHHVKPSVSGSCCILYLKLNKRMLIDHMMKIYLDLSSSVRHFCLL
jgi:4-diphosphocytidyl-2C-methyl-D-erythritol kinase